MDINAIEDRVGRSSRAAQQMESTLNSLGLPVNYQGMYKINSNVFSNMLSNLGVAPHTPATKTAAPWRKMPTYSMGPWKDKMPLRRRAYNPNLTPAQNERLFQQFEQYRNAARKTHYEQYNTDAPEKQAEYAGGKRPYPFFFTSTDKTVDIDPNADVRVYSDPMPNGLDSGFAGVDKNGAPFTVAAPKIPFVTDHELRHIFGMPYSFGIKGIMDYARLYMQPRQKLMKDYGKPQEGYYADTAFTERQRADLGGKIYAMRNFGQVPKSWEHFEEMYRANAKNNPAIARDTDPELSKNIAKNSLWNTGRPMPSPETDHENVFQKEFDTNAAYRQYDEDVKAGKRQRDPKIEKSREWRNLMFNMSDNRRRPAPTTNGGYTRGAYGLG